ncbi:PAS domain S-box protein [Algibacter sp.]|nr:PAS domain S-box protein [Algibacter sp.]MDC1226673.1 PAS domain S-box protein [Algibacter sp.]
MSQKQIDILQRALAREKAARKQAELILEEKSTELYNANEKLEQLYRDIEAELTRTDSQLQGVFENIVDAYVIIDLTGNVMKMNDAFVSLVGYRNSRQNLNLFKILHPKEKKRVAESFKSLINSGSITDFHVNIITKKKKKKLVHINASIIYDKGLPVAAQGIVRDITASRKAEDNLIESENRLASLILNLDSGIVVEDENRKIVLTNKKFCDLFDIQDTPESLIGMDCAIASQYTKKLFADPDAYVEKSNDIFKNKTTILGDELTMIDGKILERDFVPIITKNESKGYLWTFTDVSIKRGFRKSLEAQRQKYRNIIANMNLGLCEVNTDGIIIMTNQSFLEMSGFTDAELIGKDAISIFTDLSEADILVEENKKRNKGESNSYELKVKIKSGEERLWLISGAPHYSLNGEIVGSIGIHLDITELKMLQLQKENLVIELEKSNDELQEYAHIVSHDLKSPLRSIDALISWIKEDNKDKLDEVSIENFKHIETTLEKMELLISDVLEYSSVGFSDQEKNLVNLDDVVHGLIDMMYKPDHVKVEVLNKLPTLTGDKTKLQQVFQNLISNAINFIDKDQGFVKIKVEELPAHYQFSVQDNGMGIEEKYHDKIFKIFHAVNKSKDSTGIGLSIVKKIVDLHDGKIWLESKPNMGTTFFFTIKK